VRTGLCGWLYCGVKRDLGLGEFRVTLACRAKSRRLTGVPLVGLCTHRAGGKGCKKEAKTSSDTTIRCSLFGREVAIGVAHPLASSAPFLVCRWLVIRGASHLIRLSRLEQLL
jgi:hypothetical protein